MAESHTFRKGDLWPGPWLADSLHRQDVELPFFTAGFLQFLPEGRVVYRIVRDNNLLLPAEGRVSLPRPLRKGCAGESCASEDDALGLKQVIRNTEDGFPKDDFFG